MLNHPSQPAPVPARAARKSLASEEGSLDALSYWTEVNPTATGTNNVVGEAATGDDSLEIPPYWTQIGPSATGTNDEVGAIGSHSGCSGAEGVGNSRDDA